MNRKPSKKENKNKKAEKSAADTPARKGKTPAKKKAGKAGNVQPHPLEEKLQNLGLDPDFTDALPPGLVSSLPPDLLRELQKAILSGDDKGLLEALSSMSVEERDRVVSVMESIAAEIGVDLAEVETEQHRFITREFRDFIQMVSAMTVVDHPIEVRGDLENVLQTMEKGGWRVSSPIRRILGGERDAGALTKGLNHEETYLIEEILDCSARMMEYLRRREELLATFTPRFRAACATMDEETIEAALELLPPAEQDRFLEGIDTIARDLDLLIPEDEEGEEGGEEEECGCDECDVTEDLEYLIEDIVDVIVGEPDPEIRKEVEAELEAMEEEGWKLLNPVRRIWEGERDLGSLTEGMGHEECHVIDEILLRLEAEE